MTVSIRPERRRERSREAQAIAILRNSQACAAAPIDKPHPSASHPRVDLIPAVNRGTACHLHRYRTDMSWVRVPPRRDPLASAARRPGLKEGRPGFAPVALWIYAARFRPGRAGTKQTVMRILSFPGQTGSRCRVADITTNDLILERLGRTKASLCHTNRRFTKQGRPSGCRAWASHA